MYRSPKELPGQVISTLAEKSVNISCYISGNVLVSIRINGHLWSLHIGMVLFLYRLLSGWKTWLPQKVRHTSLRETVMKSLACPRQRLCKSIILRLESSMDTRLSLGVTWKL